MRLIEFFAPAEEIGREQMVQVADNYNPAESEAVLTIGHPRTTDAPALAFVKRVLYSAGKLYAEIWGYDDAMFRFPGYVCDRDGRKYRNVSGSFYPPGHPDNPRPGEWYLDHIGLLGAAKPRVSGLKPFSRGMTMTAEELLERLREMLIPTVHAADPDEGGAEEGREMTMEEREAAMQEREMAVQQREEELANRERSMYSDYAQRQIASLVEAGKISPGAEANGFLECAQALAGNPAQKVLFDTLSKRSSKALPTTPITRPGPATASGYAESRGRKAGR